MKPEVAYNLKVGDIVMLYNGFLCSPAGTVAVVYETYRDFDNKMFNEVSIITEEGEILGVFSFVEQQQYLEYIRSTDLDYKFISVIRLDIDFKKGIFKKCFV